MYCRFAPGGPQSTPHSLAQEDLPLVLHATKAPRSRGSRHNAVKLQILDPVTGHHAAFACAGVFLPLGLQLEQLRRGPNVFPEGNPSGSSDQFLHSSDEETESAGYAQRSEQAVVYRRTCRPFLPATPGHSSCQSPRHVYMAYGQTASGKTHSLFGAPSSSSSSLASSVPRERFRRFQQPPHRSWWEAQMRSPTAGVVSRYLLDLFQVRWPPPPGSGAAGGDRDGQRCAYVDCSCFEIYNEVTTDLVGLAVAQSEERSESIGRTLSQDNVLLRRCASSGSTVPPMWYSDSGEEGEDDCQLRSAVDLGVMQYEQEHGAQTSREEGSSLRRRCVFKATEKGNILRTLHRARCRSAVHAWVVICEAVRRRQRRRTDRNVASSRGHLLIRLEAYLTDVTPRPPEDDPRRLGGEPITGTRETVFVDLAGSESYRAPVLARHGHSIQQRRSHSNPSFARTDSGRLSTATTTSSQLGPMRSFSSRSSHSNHENSRPRHYHSTSQRPPSSIRSSRHAQLRYAATPLDNPWQERATEAAESAKRVKEMRSINKSLLALRKVIHAFHTISSMTATSSRPQNGARLRDALHAPFKDSALTTILEPFLLPNLAWAGTHAETEPPPRVVLLLCCSNRQRDFHETISSLRLGAEASAVQTTVVRQALSRDVEAVATGVAARQRSHVLPGKQHPTTSCQHLVSNLRHSGVAAPPEEVAPAPTVPRTAVGTADEAQQPAMLPPGVVEKLNQLQRELHHANQVTATLQSQFAQLCQHYEESVEELAAARRRVAEQDALLRALRSGGEGYDRGPLRGGAHPTLPVAPTALPVEIGSAKGRSPWSPEVVVSPNSSREPSLPAPLVPPTATHRTAASSAGLSTHTKGRRGDLPAEAPHDPPTEDDSEKRHGDGIAAVPPPSLTSSSSSVATPHLLGGRCDVSAAVTERLIESLLQRQGCLAPPTPEHVAVSPAVAADRALDDVTANTSFDVHRVCSSPTGRAVPSTPRMARFPTTPLLPASAEDSHSRTIATIAAGGAPHSASGPSAVAAAADSRGDASRNGGPPPLIEEGRVPSAAPCRVYRL